MSEIYFPKQTGVNLNYSVTGGVVEPTNPKENMIWVNTDIIITDYIFSAIEPEDRNEGTIWFKTGTNCSSPINILKKNNITIYPISCKQYINNIWVEKTAKTYQKNKWIDWIIYLFKSEIGEIEDFTSAVYTSNATITFNADKIDCDYSTVSSAWAVITTANELNLSDKNMLCLDMKITETYANYGGQLAVGITPAQGTIVVNSQPEFSAKTNPEADDVRKIVSVPLTGIESGYVTIYGIFIAEIYNIWLE